MKKKKWKKSNIMFKIIFILFLAPLFISAKVHYAKVEPYESVILKSAVSGLVIDVDLDAEGTMVRGKRVIHLDDVLDKTSLSDTKTSVKLLEDMLVINREIASSLSGTVTRQEGYYKRISKLSTASKTQKDNAYSSFTSAKTQYLSTKEKIVSLNKQILDMKYRVSQLKDTVYKKSIVLEDKYLYKLMVRKGDFVAPGVALAHIKDANRAKLVLFLEPEELNDVEKKSVYIDGNKTEYKVNKVWRIADEKFISSYRAEIYIPAPKNAFSKLVKIELK
jgi:multidrug resistance efflux pump